MTEQSLTYPDGMPLDQFIQRFADDGPFELIAGEVLPMAPNVSGHSRVIKRLFLLLHPFEAQGLGEVFTETTFAITDEAHWVRGARVPDVMWIDAKRLKAFYAQPDADTKPFTLVPNIAAEVVSPTDRYSEVNRKAELYLSDGVQLVWVIDPQQQTIHVYTAGSSTITVLSGEDNLTGRSLLPGFTVAVRAVFVVS